MCNQSCLSFGHDNLTAADIRGKSVIEVGSRNINGSLRPLVESFTPASYVGVDMVHGDGVDEVCEAGGLIERFGPESFDVLISTEMLEHVHDWQRVIDNFKLLLRPAGLLLITTRSRGFPYHEAPYDFWRYEISDMKEIFSDFIIGNLQSDPEEPGVFLTARKPLRYVARDLSGYLLYSMVAGKLVHSVEPPVPSEYEGKLVRREGNTPEDSKVYIVRGGRKHWIISAGWIIANGLRWPEDVNVLPSGDLERIPTGDPIQ
jgi:SAM-dependent methyltransferase